MYAMCCVATWQLRRRDVRPPPPLRGFGEASAPFRVPAPALVIVLALLVIGWMLTSVTRAEWTAFAIALGVATAIFVFRRKEPGRATAPRPV
jgi:hypothetical protein